MPESEEIIELVISEIDWFIIKKVKEIRVAKKISQFDLAVALGLSDAAIGKIENPKERAKYNIRHLNLLAKALNCPPRDLLPEGVLPNDMVKIRLRRTTKRAKGESNFEEISMERVVSRGQKQS
jgi:transcriptional regulator with XRE-family HTH domain